MRADKDAPIAVAATGTANTASVLAAFRRLGLEARVVREPAALRDAPLAVLPGVGTLAPAMASLEARGLAGVLRERVGASRPTLAICLGMQLLCRGSEESPGIPGLGCVPATIRRLPAGVRVPHMGWNQVAPGACSLLEPGEAYFAHSFALAEPPRGWSAATTPYPTPFVSALQRGAVLACQFHPELSGSWGARLLARWAEQGRTAVAGGASC